MLIWLLDRTDCTWSQASEYLKFIILCMSNRVQNMLAEVISPVSHGAKSAFHKSLNIYWNKTITILHNTGFNSYVSKHPTTIIEVSTEQRTAKLPVSMEFDHVFKEMPFISRIIFIFDIQRLIRTLFLLHFSIALLSDSINFTVTCWIYMNPRFSCVFWGCWAAKWKHSSVGQSFGLHVCVWTTGQWDF